MGDLDSISAAGTEWAAAHGVPIEEHPADKDSTDTALALSHAHRLGAGEIVLFGGVGIDRFDHLLGTVAALGDPGLAEVGTLTAHLGASTLYVLHPGHEVQLELAADAVFSLLALHGDCTGVDVRRRALAAHRRRTPRRQHPRHQQHRGRAHGHRGDADRRAHRGRPPPRHEHHPRPLHAAAAPQQHSPQEHT